MGATKSAISSYELQGQITANSLTCLSSTDHTSAIKLTCPFDGRSDLTHARNALVLAHVSNLH